MSAEPTSILYGVEHGVATVTLHRPEKLNAYTTEMGDEVVAAFARARSDEAVRAVVLTGAGRAFCAGVDLEHLKAHQAVGAAGSGPPSTSGASATSGSEAGAGAQRPPTRLGEEDFLRKLPLELLDYPKPVIAAINGPAIGVGVTMTLPCDVRLAAEGAKLGLTFAKLGLLPGLGSTHLLPRLVGMAKALELVLTARVITAFEAADIGLVNRVVANDDLLAEAHAMGRAMAEHRPEVLAAAKAALRYGADATMAEAMRNEQEASAALRKALAGSGASRPS
jgi:enoyl-CoA hydratase/carnithine racemase